MGQQLDYGGGSPMLFQHLFWFFGHPEVYIVALPAFGIVSDLISVHARKNIFGYRMMVWAILAIGGLSFMVWAHHMYVSGMNPYFGFFFAITTLIIAIPTAIKVYNWVLTLWRGNIHLTVPMLFAIGFIFTFINGGLTGLFLGNVTVDLPLSDTMFVVAHFHMVMAVSPILVVFGAIYHWYPKITGRMLNDTLGKFHFWVTFLGTYAIYYPMHYLGFLGVPRRYYAMGNTDFIPESAQSLNAGITIAALIVGAIQWCSCTTWSGAISKASHRVATPGAPPRWSGKPPTPRRSTATSARRYRWSIAGPTTIACRAPTRTSYRKTSRRVRKSRASRKRSRDDRIGGRGRNHGRCRRVAIAANPKRQALDRAASGPIENVRAGKRVVPAPVKVGLGCFLRSPRPVRALDQRLLHAQDGGGLDHLGRSDGAVVEHGCADAWAVSRCNGRERRHDGGR